MKISEIHINPSNPRLIKDDRFKKLVKSIEEFPKMMELRPIIIDKDNMILGGNMRFKALQELKYKNIPDGWIKRAEELTDEEKRRFIISDNVPYGEHDWDILANEWDQEELLAWGLEIPDFALNKPEAVEDDYVIPDEIKTDIVLGDLFEIGQHRLLCGDSTNSDQVAMLMNGQKADMVFTDPPYGMKLDAGGFDDMPTAKGTTHKSYSNVIGDNDDFTPELIHSIFTCFGDTKEIFIWGADYFAELLPNKNDGSWVVWDKRQEGGMDNMFGASFELCWSKSKHKREIARVLWAGYFGMSKDDTKTRVHPTQKPIELANFFFNKWGSENDLIADIFLGSGTAMVASHQLKRKCYGMELDPKYCQVIIDRMKLLDPSIEIKKNGGIIDKS